MRAVLLALLIIIAGCRGEAPSSGFDVRSDLLLSASELAEVLNDVTILHVGRDSTSYLQSHVPGAVFFPLSAVAVNRDSMLNVLPSVTEVEAAFEAAGVSDDRRVVLYGDMNGLAAARAFFALDVIGHQRKSLLDGGLAAWKAAGQPVSREVPVRRRGNITPQLRPAIVLDSPTVNNRRIRERTLLIDARPRAQYTGENPGTGIQRPGHIPQAVSLFWQEDLTEEGLLDPPDSLHARYAAAGVSPDRHLITYCRTGMQSSFTYFVLRYLGYDPVMYDGSYHDWSNNTRYPTAIGG